MKKPLVPLKVILLNGLCSSFVLEMEEKIPNLN